MYGYMCLFLYYHIQGVYILTVHTFIQIRIQIKNKAIASRKIERTVTKQVGKYNI